MFSITSINMAIWHLNCLYAGMQHTLIRFPKVLAALVLFALLIPTNAPAENLSTLSPASSEGLAFARYLASLQERNPFTEAGPVAVAIEASLPGLYKQTNFLAIRLTGESEHSEYHVLQIEGDSIVAQEVIARYLEVQEQVEELPLSSVAITPANYKFHYKGQVGTGGALAYVYQIIPKKKRDGLIQGQLWIDSATGLAVLQEGRLVKTPPPFTGQIQLVRDTQLQDGSPAMRVTHVTIETPRAGRGELTITEMPLPVEDEKPEPKFGRIAQN